MLTHDSDTDAQQMDNLEGYMLVYEHKCNGRKMVPGGIAVLSEMDLVMMTSLYPEIRVVKKAIKPKSTSLDIFKADLMTDEEKEAAAKDSKKKAGKTEEIPWKVFLGHEMADHEYTELVILVPEVVAKGGKDETGK